MEVGGGEEEVGRCEVGEGGVRWEGEWEGGRDSDLPMLKRGLRAERGLYSWLQEDEGSATMHVLCRAGHEMLRVLRCWA